MGRKVLMGACCELLSPIFNLVRLRAGSVLAPSLLHGRSGFLVLGAVDLGIYLRGKLWSS
ncbi:MAG: hypothetical protein DRQ08_08045 [Candidatus Latescibacterota bacterium]|nr:MAG: hypothetical protein DRQ08_08045 [Candidatus Latescibacterota bacterium]